jgi:hypothetical protein
VKEKENGIKIGYGIAEDPYFFKILIPKEEANRNYKKVKEK